jgi:bifunctional UDP-N-acetylglucosamine pyrophosphorylase/glucosamine-1-phosphate N-acetyltransferase
MIRYAIDTARQVSDAPPVLVIGHAAEQVRHVAGDAVQTVIQEPQLGTGHALQQARSLLEGNTDLLLVTTADMPLLTASTLQRLVSAQVDHAGPLTLLSVQSDEPRFGVLTR